MYKRKNNHTNVNNINISYKKCNRMHFQDLGKVLEVKQK